MALKINEDLSAAELRALARRETNGRVASRLLALAGALWSCPSTWWKLGVTEAVPFQATAVEIRVVSGLVPAAMSSAIGSVCM